MDETTDEYQILVDLSKPLRDYMAIKYGLMSSAELSPNSIIINKLEIGIPNIINYENGYGEDLDG